jgi:signal peptide peptidase SppA
MRNLSKDFKGNRPMLIQPAQAEAYLNRVSDMEIPMGAKMSEMGDMLTAIFGAKPTLEKFPPYAIIPVKGVIGKNLSEMESLCGCCDIHDVEEMLEECERDASIKAIILDIDSPGGTSVGVPELANRIKNCSKEVISFTGSECCSAAYWIGSQASSFYATPSSSVGSVGVYIAFPDCSEAYKMEGVKMEVIKSGTYKGAGIPGTSLDEGQRKMLQQEVEDIHSDFKEAVKSVRSFVEDSSMEGQQFSGKRAAEAGMVTSLINGFDELIQSLDPAVFAQVEADEENDDRHAVSGIGAEEGEDESKAFAKAMSAADRALSKLKAKASGEEEEDDEEEDEEEKAKSKSEDEEPKEEDGEEDKEKSEDEDEDAKPESEEEEEPKEEDGDEKPESEDDDDKDPKEEDGEEKPESENEEGDEGSEPQPDDEDKPDEGKSKEDAEDEDDSGDKAVDTDEKHNKSGVKKNRSKGVA